jgi:hypothetical protein
VRALAGHVVVLVMVTTVAVSQAAARVVRMQTVVHLTDRSDPAVKIQVLQDTVVLATVATHEDDDDEAPDNARNQ